jgi:hypothetical protein
VSTNPTNQAAWKMPQWTPM